VIAELILVTVLARSENAAFDDAYATAMRLCVALAPQNTDQLGDVVPDETAFWFRAARLKASTTFWNPEGRAWLRGRRPGATDSIESACDVQLLREAEQQREVEAPYPADLSLRR